MDVATSLGSADPMWWQLEPHLAPDGDPDVEAVDGEGVIGGYPILLPGARPYTYQSCITAEQFGGEMGGWFDFVPEGTREYSSDRRYLQAHVESFSTQLPSFIY